MSSPAVVAAMGAVSCWGAGIESGWEAVREGRDGLTPLSVIPPPPHAAPLTAQATFQIGTGTGANLPPNRTAALALLAATEAWNTLPAPLTTEPLHIVTATTVAGISRSERFYKSYLQDNATAPRAKEELAAHEPAVLSAFLGRHFGARALYSLSTACSTGLHALGLGMRLIAQRQCSCCLVVAADALSELTIRGFGSLTLLAPEGCMPFDADRAGISLGEGAGAIVLASADCAETAGITPHAVIEGWGASADAHHMTAPHPEGRGAGKAMRAALNEAKCTPEDIDMIATHGTASPDNDFAEATALKNLFKTVPPFFSQKRTIGHTLAASGLLETIFAIRAMEEEYVPRSGGFATPDESIGLTPSNGVPRPIHRFIKNAFGFGGNNASLVCSRNGDRT